MRFIVTLLTLLPLLLFARDNPFTPNNQHETVKPQVSKPKVHPQRHVVAPNVPVEVVKQEKKTAAPTVLRQVHKPIHAKTKPKIHPRRKSFKKEVVNYEKARFVFQEKSVYIETKDKMIKHFSIVNPPSIVIDYKAKSDFASKRKILNNRFFTKLEMGSHRTRYRVVFRLDKKHRYALSKTKYGQLLSIVDE